ncbi:MAG TPA: phosphate ABC transporter substrate-binding protein PstS [bacterium]|nr:phosphate ABC transporter substrate-binding protein PstS [bacterium]
MNKFMRIAGAAAVALGLAASASALSLNGAGSTFIYPLASKWFYEYNQNTGVEINYQSIGSGAGIKQLQAGTVDFGASDAYMTPEQMGQVPGGAVLNLPATMGAVVITYNIPNVDSGMHLDGKTLARIFMGEITNWNAPEIAALNPGMNLPDLAITVVHRADGSGTTNIFTNYLTKVSLEWAGSVGTGTAVKWPTGVGGKGNEAVAGVVRQVAGAIGYVELAYVIQNKMTYAFIKNRAGNFIEPSIASVSSAAEGALPRLPDDFRMYFTNARGAESYPICGFTWFLVPTHFSDPAKGKAFVDFLNWAMDEGQKESSSLNYAPLPDSLVAKIKDKIATITY